MESKIIDGRLHVLVDFVRDREDFKSRYGGRREFRLEEYGIGLGVYQSESSTHGFCPI